MSSKIPYFTTREATPLELQAQKVKRPENKPGRVVYLYLTLLFHVKKSELFETIKYIETVK